MGNVFTTGDLLASEDLKVEFRDSIGNFIDPVSISFAIFDLTYPLTAVKLRNFSPVLVTGCYVGATRVSTGKYYAAWKVPVNANLGMYKIVWKYIDPITELTKAIEEEFSVVGLDPRYAVGGIVSPGTMAPAPVPPPESVFFELFGGSTKEMVLVSLDDNGNPTDLTGFSSVILHVAMTTPVFERTMVVVSPPTSGTMLYTFIPSDTETVLPGTYRAQIFVYYTDGRETDLDPFNIKVLPTV